MDFFVEECSFLGHGGKKPYLVNSKSGFEKAALLVVANGCFDSVFNESNFVTTHVILNIDPNEFALDAERENAFKLVVLMLIKLIKTTYMSGSLEAPIPANLPPGLKCQGLKIFCLRPSRGLGL